MLVKTAKKIVVLYIVEEMRFDDFLDLKILTESTSFSFGNDNSDDFVRFSDACVFKVKRKIPDKFFHKTSYKESQYKVIDLQLRSARGPKNETVVLECAYKFHHEYQKNI